MDRDSLIADLHQYWLDLQALTPDEEVGDIAGAVQYYRTLPWHQLLAEWREKCC